MLQNSDFERKFRSRLLLLLGLSFFIFFVSVLGKIVIITTAGEKGITKDIESYLGRILTIKIPVYRGSIKDSTGKELALSVPTLSIYAHPDTRNIKHRERVIRELSSLTGIPAEKIRKRFAMGKSKPVKLLSGIDIGLKEDIKRLIRETGNASYLGVQEEYRRLYPNATLASNLIGFVGVDGIGLEGLEYKLNNYLGGGYKTALVSLQKGLGSVYLEPLKGYLGKENDVYLTIDVSIQSIAEAIRDEIVSKWKPKKVFILVMELSEGHILALANYPYFDPNKFSKYKSSTRKNHAITDVFEPGSVLKPLFVGWALEKGYIRPRERVNTGRGIIDVYGRRVKDIKPLGTVTTEEVLIHSSNVGTIKIAQKLQEKDLIELIQAFHLNDRFSIFPGEAKPQIPNLTYPSNRLYISMGQGIALNTLNLAVAFGALATGNILKPHIVKEVVSPQEKTLFRAKKEVLRERVLSSSTLRWLRKTLIDVVEKGTGKRARSRYFYIAGKTGTAQKFDKKLNKYSKERVVTSFAGFFPATDPKFVALIVVDEPKGKNLYGGVVSAPYFRKLAEQVAFYYGLEPDKLQ